jgi:hypothetical protein
MDSLSAAVFHPVYLEPVHSGRCAAYTRSLSDLTLFYCGKAGLGHFCCSFSLNSSLFAGRPPASKDQQN